MSKTPEIELFDPCRDKKNNRGYGGADHHRGHRLGDKMLCSKLAQDKNKNKMENKIKNKSKK